MTVMTVKFFSKLSQNYIELLKDDEYYDITIEVGEDPNVKIFRAHMNILHCRSSYLKEAFASNKRNINDNALVHIKLPNISPESFQIVLEYIYGGTLSLDGQEPLDLFKVLTAADELHLQELVDYLQEYLIENKSEWIEQHFEFVQKISSKSNNLTEIQDFCTDLMTKSPETIFNSFDLTSFTEKSLITLIRRDDLQMEETKVWENVLKWGLAQNPSIISDPDTWSDDHFKTMKLTLKNCLPLIRFTCLSSKEFSQKVRPYQKLFDHQLYEDLLNYYLDPDKVSNHNVSIPRKINKDDVFIGAIDSQIVDAKIALVISKWIYKSIRNEEFTESYLPCGFKLLLRGTRDGFSPEKFHELCDDIPNTVTFIKIKGTEEIIGGGNPLTWKSSTSYGKTKGSFIFSFKNKNNLKNAIFSHVKDKSFALRYSPNFGPCFGDDIIIYSSKEPCDNYDIACCQQFYYKKMIRDTEDLFSIDDYEVFQIIE